MSTEEVKHSRYSPSGAYRWIACPGSVTLSDKCPPVKASPYALEGTVAHKLAELCILNNHEASDYIGKEVVTEEITLVVTKEMAEAVQVYVDECREDADIDDYIGVEKKFDLSWLHPGMFGSNDFYRYKQDSKKLKVVDYKHGAGIEVDVEWNPQLMVYAIGAIKNICDAEKTPLFDSFIEEVELVIVQPRIYREETIKRWSINATALMFWAVNVLRPRAIAVDVKTNELLPGDHCKFCQAHGVCPEIAKQASELAQVAFEDVTEAALPQPDAMPMETIVKILNIAPVFKSWAEATEKYALNLLQSGQTIPGYKLVKKNAHRKWINEAEVVELLSEVIPKELLYSEPKMLTPAKVEKLKELKAIGGKKVLQSLITQPDIGCSLAPESDKREAIDASCVSAFPELDFDPDMDFM